MKRLDADWEKICIEEVSDKGLLSKIYKELLKLKKKDWGHGTSGRTLA
jgi:hypothetical protein